MKCRKCKLAVERALPRCPGCGEWGTLERWQRLGDLAGSVPERCLSGVDAIDQLVGGDDGPGFVRGCVYRISGKSGCGKSTLALMLATRFARGHGVGSAAYLCKEEAPEAIRLRANRIGCSDGAETLLVGEISSAEDLRDLPESVIFGVVDSISVLRSAGVSGAPGSNEQLEHATEELVAHARARGTILLVVSHVNKKGQSKGSSATDHGSDCELLMRRQRKKTPGRLWSEKNRHGPAPVAYLFRHVTGGLALDREPEEQEEE